MWAVVVVGKLTFVIELGVYRNLREISRSNAFNLHRSTLAIDEESHTAQNRPCYVRPARLLISVEGISKCSFDHRGRRLPKKNRKISRLKMNEFQSQVFPHFTCASTAMLSHT